MQAQKAKPGFKLVKILFRTYEEIPKDWELVKLGDIAKIASGGTPRTNNKQYWENGNIPWINSGKVQNCEVSNASTYITEKGLKNSSAKLFPKNTILIALTGATTGNIGLLNIETTTNQSVTGIFPSSKYVPTFLFYLLIKMKKHILRYSVGTAQPHINQQIIKNFLIFLPNLKEQQNIASILSDVDNAILNTNQLIKQTQLLQKGITKKLLTEGIGHTKFKKEKWIFRKEIEMPKEWELKKFSDICKKITVGIVVKPASLYVDKGVPCFRSLNILENKINQNDLVYISEDGNKEHSKSILKEGDILIVRTGEPGTSCIVPKEYEGANCIDLLILRTNNSVFNEYLSRYINSSLCKHQIIRFQVGTSQQHFNVKFLKQILTLIPPLSEQKQIVSILSNIDSKIQKLELHRSNLELLKKGLMQNLLTGKIRTKF